MRLLNTLVLAAFACAQHENPLDSQDLHSLDRRAIVWPSQVFAPYLDNGDYPTPSITAFAKSSGVLYYTVAFLIADGNNLPAWSGSIPLSQKFYLDEITSLRALGGDVIISFGGAAGSEVAEVITDVNSLAAVYQSVIDTYSLTRIDFDIEGSVLYKTDSVDRRNAALVILKQNNRNLVISYTLPVLPQGLDDAGLYVIKSAVAKGLQIDVVNIMAMDFGDGAAPNGATGMGAYAIQAAQGTYSQCNGAGLSNFKIGITPMIGVNDVQTEIFRVADAQMLLEFALSNTWVGRLSMWSMSRDNGDQNSLGSSSMIQQSSLAFSSIFVKVENSNVGTAISTTPVVVAPSTPSVSTPTSSGWPSQFFAPFCDVLLYPSFNVAAAAKATGVYYYHLAFIVSDGSGNPSWGGSVALSQKWYMTELTQLRAIGGDVIISFGGASGSELASVVTNLNSLVAAYQSVITMYTLTRIDFDVEGGAIADSAAIDRRNQAIVILKKNNPNLIVSYTLPVLPSGLDSNGLTVITSAVANGAGALIGVVNLMTMDYGSGVAPNGATGMGGYAIQAAKAVFAQVTSAGMTNFKIGVTPMIGQNDVAGEIFRVQDAELVTLFAKSNSWIGVLSMWSIARDTGVYGPLYISSQVSQSTFDFSNIFVGVLNGASSPTTPTASSAVVSKPSSIAPVPPKPSPAKPVPTKSQKGLPSSVPLPPVTKGNSQVSYAWQPKVFAPYVDVVTLPAFDLVKMSSSVGTARYTLAFISSDNKGKPSWGGKYPISSSLFYDQVSAIRNFGGDVIISFGGATGTELALSTADAKVLQGYYQDVIDAYSISWIDFDIEGSALSNRVSVDRRNQAIRYLQVAQPSLRVSYTLPVTTSGLTTDGIYLLQSAITLGVRIDVVNILALDFASAAAPNGLTDMGSYAIQSATSTYAQAHQIGLPDTTLIGICVMIGQNDANSQVFTIVNTKQLVTWALQQPWVGWLSYWNVNRDNSVRSADLIVSSNLQQSQYQFAQNFVKFEN